MKIKGKMQSEWGRGENNNEDVNSETKIYNGKKET